MTIEIRHVRDEELPAFVDAMTTAFLERPDTERAAEELRPLWDLERTWAALDGDRVCGTFRSWPTEITLPGGDRLPAAAVSGVTVLPTHRRRGILRQMVAAEHRAARDRGEPIALLYATEYPIYGRFGYGAAAREATWTLDAGATAFHGAATGSTELHRPSTGSRDAIVAVFEAWRVRQPGEIRRRSFSWDYDLALRDSVWGDPWKGFLVLHHDADGTTDGYARYHVEEKWEQRQPRNTLVVDDMHALADDADVALWRYLAEVDWVARVRAGRRSPDERLPWLLTNARAASVDGIGDGLWARLLDVPRALEARTYAEQATVVLELADGEATGGRVRVELEAGVDGSACRVTTRSPDLSIDVSALGAAYLGGVRLRDAVLATGVDEHRPGALAATERLFRTDLVPWCSTFF